MNRYFIGVPAWGIEWSDEEHCRMAENPSQAAKDWLEWHDRFYVETTDEATVCVVNAVTMKVTMVVVTSEIIAVYSTKVV